MDSAEILRLLQNEADEALFSRAEALVIANHGRRVFVRGLVEFSNICRRNCFYCGLRVQNAKLARYRLSQEQILSCAKSAVSAGADTIVLQSGEGACQRDWLGEIVREITRTLHVPVTMSVGECNEADYAFWRICGASRYLLKHETADEGLYARLHPGHNLAERVRCLTLLKDLGYEIGDGFMVGLPGQTLEIIARDIALCAALGADMCGIGPFIAQKDTPLAKCANGSTRLTLRALAVLRMALPRANLPATTALASLDPVNGQLKGLLAGANVLMPSFTPRDCSANYAIYDNKNRVNMEGALLAIARAGRRAQKT